MPGWRREFTDRWPALAADQGADRRRAAQLPRKWRPSPKACADEYQAAVARVGRLQALVAEERNKDFASNDAALEDAILSRRVETNRELYTAVLSASRKSASPGRAGPRTRPSRRRRPRRNCRPTRASSRTLAIAGLGGVIIGLAAVLLLDKLDKRFKSVDEVERALRLPKFALIPDFATVRRRCRHRRRRDQRRWPRRRVPRPWRGGGGPRAPGSSARSIPRLTSLHYRPLHVALQFSRAGGSPRLMMFTSATPQEGKTASAAGAHSRAPRWAADTLLIDADLHRPQCHDLVATERPDRPQRHSRRASAGSPTRSIAAPTGSSSSRRDRALRTRPRCSAREPCASFSSRSGSRSIMCSSIPRRCLRRARRSRSRPWWMGSCSSSGPTTPRKAVLEAYTALRRAGAVVLGFVFNRVDLTLPQHRGYANYPSYEGYYYNADDTKGAAA